MKAMQLAAVLAFVIALGSTPAAAQTSGSNFVPVTDEMLANPDPNDWLMWRRTHNSWGYSPLNQIDKSNVGRLRMVGRAAWALAFKRPRRWFTTA